MLNDSMLPHAKGYNGCRCRCHSDSSIHHIVACCTPTKTKQEIKDQEWVDDYKDTKGLK